MYVSSLFPRADTYVLVGLEPVGTVPDLRATNPDLLVNRLSRVMDKPLRHGYYVTEEMRQGPPVTPILLTTLGLMGARVDSVQAIDAGGYPGVQIGYRDPHRGSKRVIYTAADLSNRGMTPAFRSWLDRWTGSTAYFKAASYLMHDNSFSSIRSWVVGNSRAVLQDDSGVPHRYYDSGEGNVTLLGTYSRPIPLFAKWRQEDLAAAYRSIGGYGPPIPFGSGYHLRVAEANYQVYTRR